MYLSNLNKRLIREKRSIGSGCKLKSKILLSDGTYVNLMWQQSNNILGQDAAWPIAWWYSKGGPVIIEAKDAGFLFYCEPPKVLSETPGLPISPGMSCLFKALCFLVAWIEFVTLRPWWDSRLLRQKYILQFSYTMILFGFKCNQHNPSV